MAISKRCRQFVIFVVGVVPWIIGALLGSEAWGRFFGVVFAIYALFKLFPRDYSHWRGGARTGCATVDNSTYYTPPYNSDNFVYMQPTDAGTEDVYAGINDLGTADYYPVDDSASYISSDDSFLSSTPDTSFDVFDTDCNFEKFD